MIHSSHNSDNYYTCPMHPEINQDKPGRCPKCGMNLVNARSLMDTSSPRHNMDHSGHDHSSMMASPETAADFLKRFFIVTALLIPLVFFSEPAVKFLGVPNFPFLPFLEFIIATVIFYFSLVFFRHAKMEIQMRQYGMMTLVSLGVGAGYLFSAASTFIPAINTEFYIEISTLIWILLFGHFLEARSGAAAGDALSEVAKLLPKKAHLKTKNGFEEVEITILKEKDIVLIKPGEKVPADGKIIKGKANFNESHITGESRPVEKTVNTEVIAGAINLDGSVEIELTRVGASSTIGQIQNLISQAKKSKPSAQKLADKAAGWLTFTALSVSIITLLFWSVIVPQSYVFAATLAITVLVIACPHALGLAIPTVSTIATNLAVANGVFIKDMAKIEIIKKADYVVFDKTGTLTRGQFGVIDIITFNIDEKELLQITGSLESHSSHVIANAIMSYLNNKKIKFPQSTNFKNLAGRGIEASSEEKKYFIGNKRLMEEKKTWTEEAEKILNQLSSQGKTPVFISDKNRILGAMSLSDQIKDESAKAIKELHDLGVKVAMLTGDTKAAAYAVAGQLGIDTVFSEVLPEDKYKHIKELQQKGNIVIMTGDGVNDAPALTQADAGVAIGAGTDVAVESGDIVLTQSNPEHIVSLIILSRKVYRKMLENLIYAAGYNILAIPAAAGLFIPLGLSLTPAVGALLMSLSSVIVVGNAMSLRKAKLTAP